MSSLFVAVAAVLLAAAPPGPPPPTGKAPIAEVVNQLRRIESAAFRQGTDELRLVYQELARQKSNDPLPRVYLAWLGQPSDDSWNQLKAIATIAPEALWPHWGMGRIYVAWKMKGPARQELELVLKRDPTFYPALVALGDLARLSDDPEEAAAKYRAALALADDAEAHTGLGLALLAQGKPEAAQAELKQGVAQWPDQPRAVEALLKLALAAKDPEVLLLATKLCDLQPKSREARKLVADLRFDAGQKADAAKEYERLLRLGNPELAVVQRLAGLYRELGQSDDEDRTLQLQASMDKADADIPMRAAELRAAKNDDEGVDAQLREALARQPGRVDALVQLARLEVRQKDLNEALENFRAAAAGTGPLAEEAKAEAKKLEESFKLPKPPASGNPNNIQWRVAGTLDRFYEERRKLSPALEGKVRLRVRVAADGVVQGVDVLEDSVKDELLLGHLYFSLRDAQFPKQKREPIFEFELTRKPK